jgi:hypothetical protein
MARYSGDPKWLTARFDSTCRKCGKRIKRGESIFYYPTGKVTYCAGECGKAASRDFEAAAFDESVYGGGKKRHGGSKTVRRSNRKLLAWIFAPASKCVLFTLDNGFVGQTVPIDYALNAYDANSDAKLVAEGYGYRLRIHSNKWYEIWPGDAFKTGGKRKHAPKRKAKPVAPKAAKPKKSTSAMALARHKARMRRLRAWL